MLLVADFFSCIWKGVARKVSILRCGNFFDIRKVIEFFGVHVLRR